MEPERILITVKTYPTLSTSYAETVCTAGIREDGSWVRIYPVPFRRLGGRERYSKYDWISCRMTRHVRDKRPESYRPVDEAELAPVGKLGTSDKWRERRKLVLETAMVFDRMDVLIADAKVMSRSLAVFKPARVINFHCKPAKSREWDPKKLERVGGLISQNDLFADNSWRATFETVRKLPYDFSYSLEDSTGRVSTLRVLDWEVGALYWNCLRGAKGDEAMALENVREMYWTRFMRTDLHFYLGTTQAWQQRAPNPWLIVGVLPIPHESRLNLFE